MAKIYEKPNPPHHKDAENFKKIIPRKVNKEEDAILEALLAEEFALTRG
jgi:hypothetical protein